MITYCAINFIILIFFSSIIFRWRPINYSKWWWWRRETFRESTLSLTDIRHLLRREFFFLIMHKSAYFHISIRIKVLHIIVYVKYCVNRYVSQTNTCFIDFQYYVGCVHMMNECTILWWKCMLLCCLLLVWLYKGYCCIEYKLLMHGIPVTTV